MLGSMFATFNTTVTETAREILGKHRQKKKNLDHCRNSWPVRQRRELRKKRFGPERSERYKEVNNNIKRCMKKAKENWIEEQCNEIEESLRKNNSKRAYQLLKDLTTETGESDYCPRSFRKMPHRRATDTEPMDRILFWAVQLQGRWESIGTELSPDRQRMTTQSFAEKWRLQYNHWRKGSQLELTTSQQNWAMHVEEEM